MLIFKIFSFFLLFYIANTKRTINWNKEEIERTVKPSVRKFKNSWQYNMYEGPFYQYKKHFGIIIKKNTTFTLTIETSKDIEELKFFCPTQKTENFIEVDFHSNGNSTTELTTNFDCVPLLSVSYNVPVVVKIKTKNWTILPIFDSRNLTFLTSQKHEHKFYKKIQTYGFVENYYTQMLVSANDIKEILSKNLSLFVGLQNQVDIIKYYNYLTGASRYVDANDSLSYFLVNKQRFFFRTERNSELAYSNQNWIVFSEGIKNTLQSNRGRKWVTLHEIAHYYDISNDAFGFGPTVEIWTNIFSALYQNKFISKNYWFKFSKSDEKNFISFYQNNVPFVQWGKREKLQFLLNLFAYDGTDKSFREFNIRYYSKEHIHKNVVIPLILEVFFDLYNINLLPFLKKVINFNVTTPLVNPDLELRLLSANPVMPAIDFNLKPTELSARSREKDWRQSLPLMLIRKMKKKYVNVTFTIESPIDITNSCLYLNNNCHTIVGKLINIKLLSDVYSSYIAKEENGNLYISDVNYHIISQETKIHLIVNEITQNSVFLPLVYYEFDAFGFSDRRFLKIFINFKTMTIGIQQLFGTIHDYFSDELYFSISLKRNGSLIFNYDFFGTQENEQLINVTHKLKVNDKIYMFHAEPSRLMFNSKEYNNLENNTFVLTNIGLKDVNDNNFKFLFLDIKRIDEFNSNYNIELSNNALYQIYFSHYIRRLRFNNMIEYIPKSWIEWQNQNLFLIENVP
ncbi:uncharacterized protein LOC127286551 [Leptopilina boulardi]|uniref:uncharacterized protein LOC127286551 n=1 Tax=Leptopilina boulardi TaxID=63433 RepID=UPI0021F59F30|nr:uncharacterized protein LOC127286551 [Leptopilina boulardi]